MFKLQIKSNFILIKYYTNKILINIRAKIYFFVSTYSFKSYLLKIAAK